MACSLPPVGTAVIPLPGSAVPSPGPAAPEALRHAAVQVPADAPDTGAAGASEPLVDAYGRRHTYLRISVTDQCNFRCRYCVPADGFPRGPDDRLATLDEIVRVAHVFAGLGIEKVRLTGGEPTVRPRIEWLIERLAGIRGIRGVHMTTNGFQLERRVRAYRDAGLRGLNISLDSLRPDRFAWITGRDELDGVLRGIDAALEAGLPVKLNTVVMAGVNAGEIPAFVEMARTRPIAVRFIEFMPFRSNGWRAADAYPFAQMLRDLERVVGLVPVDAGPAPVAREFRIPGYAGTVGFIASMSHSFCAACSRVRLTADGRVRACLFSSAEEPLLPALRAGCGDDAIERAIRTAVRGKQREHAPMEQLVPLANRSMLEIGG